MNPSSWVIGVIVSGQSAPVSLHAAADRIKRIDNRPYRISCACAGPDHCMSSAPLIIGGGQTLALLRSNPLSSAVEPTQKSQAVECSRAMCTSATDPDAPEAMIPTQGAATLAALRAGCECLGAMCFWCPFCCHRVQVLDSCVTSGAFCT